MPGKTITLAVIVFFLSIAIHSACFGATLPKLSVDLTKTLDEQLNEQMAKHLEARVTAIELVAPTKLGLCGGVRTMYPYYLCCCHRFGSIDLIEPNFLHLYAGNISIAFLNCTSINLLILETSAPIPSKWASVLINDLFDDYLILNKTETSEGYAMRIMDRLLSEAQDPEFTAIPWRSRRLYKSLI